MDASELIKQAKRIVEDEANHPLAIGMLTEATEFLRVYAGEKSTFYKNISLIKPGARRDLVISSVAHIMKSFIHYVESGLLDGMSIEREAKIEVVSELLEQARIILSQKNMHAGAAAMLIGAVLEEFLREWVEELELEITGSKTGIESYGMALKSAGLINRQDIKDITSWGGLRNDAAHGNWEDVKDRNKISIMLDGVNLFMRKYGALEVK